MDSPISIYSGIRKDVLLRGNYRFYIIDGNLMNSQQTGQVS